MDKNLQTVYDAYKKWVITNPNIVTEVETLATWSSYFIAGKINKSPIVSELVYSLSKLLSFFNDRLIREAHGAEAQYYGLRYQLKLWLTIIHYCEVFAELAVKHKWGSRGKWTIAVVLQLFKCSSALILLYRFKELPIAHPPISALQRRKLMEKIGASNSSVSYFTLQRSGRVVRCVDGSPPVAFRDWQPLRMQDEAHSLNVKEQDLYSAELLHIFKPIIHLAAMKYFGTKSWKQWLIALSLDLTSMNLYHKNLHKLSSDQRLEVNRRNLSLVLYLLRSPMYNGCPKTVIENVLMSISKNVPMTSFLCTPIMQYLSHWQDIYFYMWSS